MMDTNTRKAILEQFDKSRASMLAVINDFEEARFCQSEKEEAWSAAKIVEHVIMVESGVLGNLKRLGAKVSETRFENPPNIPTVIEESSNRATKVPAPEIFIPKGLFKNKQSSIDAFSKHRDVIEQFVQTTEIDLKSIAFPHPRLGMYNGENWLAFMIGHSQRHIEQISLLTN